ncbi:MAG: biotin--[acetyl-CoA-carboxylase] ligase [Planctomycetales bacterium]
MTVPWSQVKEFDKAILNRLVQETFLQDVQWREEVASTNNWAIAESREKGSEREPAFPQLYLCETQTAGRGRGGNSWWATTGALTFSVVSRFPTHLLPLARRPLLSLAIGLAITEAARKVTGSSLAQLKWPNDVYLNGRKTAGILIDVPSQRGDLLVIGVGVNVGCDFSDAPPDVRDSAISIHEATGCRASRPHMLFESIRCMEFAIKQVAEEDPSLIDRANAIHWLNGRDVRLQLPRETILGRVERIDADGALVIRTQQGLRRSHSGTIAMVR